MFEAAIGWLGMVLLFLVGLVARALLAVLVIAALVVPIALVLLAWRGVTQAIDYLAGLRRVGQVRWWRQVYYTPGHLWLKPGRGGVRIGLDDIAQRVLPEILAVHLPAEDSEVRAGDPMGHIHCPDGVVALRAPVSGRIRAVNHTLRKRPSLIHQDCYRGAWLVDVRPDSAAYRENLRTGAGARAWLAGEERRLNEFLTTELGVAAADGGELVLPAHRLLTGAQWNRIRGHFLGSDPSAVCRH